MATCILSGARGLLTLLPLVVAMPAWAQSRSGLAEAPAELAAHGFTHGKQVLDDPSGTYYVAEYDPLPTDPHPAELAVVVLRKGGANDALVSVEAAAATDGNGAPVSGRRISSAGIHQFNSAIVPAMVRAVPELSRSIRITQLIYIKGAHFLPDAYFADRQKVTRAAFEQPLVELVWQRNAAGEPFAPHPRLLAGVPAEALPVTAAETARERAAQGLPRRPSVAPARTGVAAASTTPASGRAGSAPANLYVDLSHYSLQNLRSEAVASSASQGIVVVAWASEQLARDWLAVAVEHNRGGAQIRAVMRANPQPGRTFDIFYDGKSQYGGADGEFPQAGSYRDALNVAVRLQSLDRRMASLQSEIGDLDARLEDFKLVDRLATDPALNEDTEVAYQKRKALREAMIRVGIDPDRYFSPHESVDRQRLEQLRREIEAQRAGTRR